MQSWSPDIMPHAQNLIFIKPGPHLHNKISGALLLVFDLFFWQMHFPLIMRRLKRPSSAKEAFQSNLHSNQVNFLSHSKNVLPHNALVQLGSTVGLEYIEWCLWDFWLSWVGKAITAIWVPPVANFLHHTSPLVLIQFQSKGLQTYYWSPGFNILGLSSACFITHTGHSQIWCISNLMWDLYIITAGPLWALLNWRKS